MSKLIGQCINEQLTAERGSPLSAESLIAFEDVAVLNDLEPILLDTDLNINENDTNTDILGVIADTAEIMESEANLTLPTKVAILESVESISAIIDPNHTLPSLESISATDDILTYAQEDFLDRVKGVFNAAVVSSDKAISDAKALDSTFREKYFNIANNFKTINFSKYSLSKSKEVKIHKAITKDGKEVTDFDSLVNTLNDNLKSLRKIEELVNENSGNILSIVNMNLSSSDSVIDLLNTLGKYLNELENSNVFKRTTNNTLSTSLITHPFITGERLELTIPNINANITFREKVKLIEGKRSDSFLSRLNKKTDFESRTSIVLDPDKHNLTKLNHIYNEYMDLYRNFINNETFVLKIKEQPIQTKTTDIANLINSIAESLFKIFTTLGVSGILINTVINLIMVKFGNISSILKAEARVIGKVAKGYATIFVATDAVIAASKGASYMVGQILSLFSTFNNVKKRSLALQLTICEFISYTIIQNMNIMASIYKQVK